MKKEFDVVGDILETLRFRGTIFFHSNLAAPWGVAFQPLEIPRFHIALAGGCYVGTRGDDFVKVEHMEIVMLPTGNSHWIADRPDRELVDSNRVGEACELDSPMFQKGDITNRLMCGLVQYDQETAHPILESLPDLIHFSHQQISQSAWATAILIDSEINRIQNNSSQIIDRLTEVLFLQLLEEHVKEFDGDIGFVAALGDPRLRQALKLIHREPGTNWTLDTLGHQIGMSRTTLNRHFKHTVGITPIAYVQDWKMMKALSLVKHSSSSLESIAEQLGFASARTLTRAFVRQYGKTPNTFRKNI